MIQEDKRALAHIEKIDYQSGTWTGKMVPRFNNWLGVKVFNLINKL